MRAIIAMPTITKTQNIEIGGSACFCLLHCLVFGIVNMVYALGHNDVECNVPHHSMGLDLGDFLFWFAVAMLIMVALTGAMCSSLCCMAGGHTSCAVGTAIAAAVAMTLVSLFMLAWSVVGAVILFQDAIGCIESQDSIGILSLVNLIVYWSSGYFYTSTVVSTVTISKEEAD